MSSTLKKDTLAIISYRDWRGAATEHLSEGELVRVRNKVSPSGWVLVQMVESGGHLVHLQEDILKPVGLKGRALELLKELRGVE